MRGVTSGQRSRKDKQKWSSHIIASLSCCANLCANANDGERDVKKVIIGTLFFSLFLGLAEARPLTSEEKSVIESSVRSQLKDPDSAKFTFPNLLEGNLTDLPGRYCGKVNAKNSYGGYSGDQWFATNVNTIKNGKVEVYTQEGSPLNIAEICKQGGYK